MELNSAKDRIFQRLRDSFKRWALLAIAALVVTLTLCACLNREDYCSATVHFKYDGVEVGLDPNGNRFDQTDFKDEALIRRALEAMGEPVSDEDMEESASDEDAETPVSEEDIKRIQDAFVVQSSVSSETLAEIIEKRSIYGEEGVKEFQNIQADTYFPTQYAITFRYKDAGLRREEGIRFLRELLNAYETSFYTRYGYNTSLERVILSIDYGAYDYIDSVEILQNHLTSLRAYLARLSNLDNTRFASKETGYSFSDLISAIDTLQAEDIQWISAYITSNNITRDRSQLIDYYQYKIEDAERALAQQDSRLYTLNGLIDNYVKTTAIFPLVGETQSSQDGETATYEFSQPSQMYDTLINDKIACQTAMSETKEQINMLQKRMERLQSEESSGNAELVEERLSTVNQKTGRILEIIAETSDEFFKTVRLEDAFQVLQEPEGGKIAVGATIRKALPALLIVEAILFGVYVLSAFRAACVLKREEAAPYEESAAANDAPQATASK